jgi:phosphopantothenoylcysteine synthetase/decarboxylase
MHVLITAGPTYEPIDPVRFIGNRSSGQMGAALATAAVEAGHDVTLVVGPVTAAMPTHERIRRIDIFCSRDLLETVLREFPSHDLLIMAAAVGDFRPKQVRTEKVERGGTMTIELEATEDIAAAAGAVKKPHQRTVGFSLVERGSGGGRAFAREDGAEKARLDRLQPARHHEQHDDRVGTAISRRPQRRTCLSTQTRLRPYLNATGASAVLNDITHRGVLQ